MSFMDHPVPRAAVRYARRWRDGDPREARGRMLFQDAEGDVWLSPAEVRALGLTELIREAERDGGREEAGTEDLPPEPEGDRIVVSASDYFQEDDPEPGQSGAPEPFNPELTEAVRAAFEADPAPLPASGEVDGWRWWVVRDADGDWLCYDNRPLVDAHAGAEGLPAAGARATWPDLVQGKVPMVVAAHAVAHEAGPLDGLDVPGTGGIATRLGLGHGAREDVIHAALVGCRLGRLTREDG